jgi:FkbM family methyltransferase
MLNKYYSQYKQDEFIDKVLFNKKENGFFIEIGAHDGISFSNTLFFEKYRNWKGMCIEPNPTVFEKLAKNRKSLNLNVCIGDSDDTVKFTKISGYAEMLSGVSSKYDLRHIERINNDIVINGGEIKSIDVQMLRLESISQISEKCIDFISIDTEGNELDIVKSIDFEKIKIKVLVIENNYKDENIAFFLNKNNFILIASLATDEVYIQKNEFNFIIKFNLFLWKLSNKRTSVLKKIKKNIK